jgi:hypothetical protein
MKAFFSTLLASLAIATPALAAPLPVDHQILVDALVADGVTVLINEPADACFDGSERNGAYVVYEGGQYLVVCQDNRKTSDVVSWTANDLDTIRHEGFHIVQDCMDGVKGDQELDTVFTSYEEVIDEYGVVNSMRVLNSYIQAYPAERHNQIQLEVEAFYAAQNYSASEIASMYQRYCK